MLLFVVSISLVGCSDDTISNDDSYIDENYESAENEDYYEDYYEDNSEDESSEYVFVSDWQEGEMNIEGNKSYRTVNGSNNFYFTEQGEWIYYIFENCIYKENLLGETILVAQFDYNPKDISIIGDWIYYFYDSCLYKIRTDGQENSVILTEIDSYYIYNNKIFYTESIQTSADTYETRMNVCTLDAMEHYVGLWTFSGMEYDNHKMLWNIVGGYDNKLFYIPSVEFASHNSYIEPKVIPYGIHSIDLETLDDVIYVEADHEFFGSEYMNHEYCIMSDYIVAKKSVGHNAFTISNALRFFDLRTGESFTVTPALNGYFFNWVFSVGYDELNDRYLMSAKTGDKREISLWIANSVEDVLNNNWTELTSDDVTSFINTKNYIYYRTAGEDTVYRVDYNGKNWETVIEVY